MSDEPRELHLTERMIPMKGGKQYLQVADRIVWFREEYPEGTIETTLVELDRQAGFCMYRARVTTGKGGFAEASGTETSKDFGDYIEKSETKAVGRALGYLGFGTASAGFEEGQRVVDAPQTPRTAPARNAAPASATPRAARVPSDSKPGATTTRSPTRSTPATTPSPHGARRSWPRRPRPRRHPRRPSPPRSRHIAPTNTTSWSTKPGKWPRTGARWRTSRTTSTSTGTA
jgi:hypothetical protein